MSLFRNSSFFLHKHVLSVHDKHLNPFHRYLGPCQGLNHRYTLDGLLGPLPFFPDSYLPQDASEALLAARYALAKRHHC
jgi:hypothetical protein